MHRNIERHIQTVGQRPDIHVHTEEMMNVDTRQVHRSKHHDQFVEALKTNLTGGWLLRFLLRNPRALAEASGIL